MGDVTFSIIDKDGRTSAADPLASARAYMAHLSSSGRKSKLVERNGQFKVTSPGLMTLIFVPFLEKPAQHYQERLEYLRGELRGECISYGELHELQSLIPYIDPHDVELLEAAGVPEFPEETRE